MDLEAQMLAALDSAGMQYEHTHVTRQPAFDRFDVKDIPRDSPKAYRKRHLRAEHRPFIEVVCAAHGVSVEDFMNARRNDAVMMARGHYVYEMMHRGVRQFQIAKNIDFDHSLVVASHRRFMPRVGEFTAHIAKVNAACPQS